MAKGLSILNALSSIDSADPDLYALFPPNEKGHYPYIVAAYKLAGKEEWQIRPLPAPFEKAVQLLEDNGIKVDGLRNVGTGGTVAFLELLDYVYVRDAFISGWTRDYRDGTRWYAPGENIPPPKYITDTKDRQIFLKLIAVAANWIEFQISQEEKKQHIIFDSLLSDGLPGIAFLLKNLIERGYGHMSIFDDFHGFFFRMSVWHNPNGTSRMIIKYQKDGIENIQWTGKAETNAVIEDLRKFLLSIADHPDFLHEYAYHHWGGFRDFENELEDEVKNFSNTPREQRIVPLKRMVDETDPPKLLTLFDDEKEYFRLQWLRENIMRLEPAKEMHEKYQLMLRELQVPDGWLDVPIEE